MLSMLLQQAANEVKYLVSRELLRIFLQSFLLFSPFVFFFFFLRKKKNERNKSSQTISSSYGCFTACATDAQQAPIEHKKVICYCLYCCCCCSFFQASSIIYLMLCRHHKAMQIRWLLFLLLPFCLQRFLSIRITTNGMEGAPTAFGMPLTRCFVPLMLLLLLLPFQVAVWQMKILWNQWFHTQLIFQVFVFHLLEIIFFCFVFFCYFALVFGRPFFWICFLDGLFYSSSLSSISCCCLILFC